MDIMCIYIYIVLFVRDRCSIPRPTKTHSTPHPIARLTRSCSMRRFKVSEAARITSCGGKAWIILDHHIPSQIIMGCT